MSIKELAIVVVRPRGQMVKAEEKPISAYILRVMKEEGWSQADVLKNASALKIRLRQATLSEILTGDTADPRILTLMGISRALHRPFEEMVAAIQGTEANSAAFKQGDFALLGRLYEALNKNNKLRADDFVDMVKSKII